MTHTKACTKCGEDKELTEFSPHSTCKYGVQSICKECKAEIERKRKLDPESRMALRDRNLKRRYGISLDEYDAMFDEQNGKCAICNTEEPGGKYKHFAVDHCHETGKVRGLLCGNCNTGIGLLGDNINNFSAAILYLERNRQEAENELHSISDRDSDLVGMAHGD
jgi:hypothetical protein